MTGFEPLVGAGVAAAGKAAPAAAGRIASMLALKIGGSATRRWRVARRVKKRTGLGFPSRYFRAWLKEVSAAGLQKPVGEAGPGLAISLDLALAADSSWQARSARHSDALRLVKETYLASVALAAPADAATLLESWADARHDELLGLLTQLVKSEPRLSREDASTLLLAQSRARRTRRLASFGVEARRLSAAFTTLDSESPTVGVGEYVVLVGAFGSGKSELAEVWFRQRVFEYRERGSEALPCWLRAGEIGARSLEDVLAQQVSEHSRRPFALVVDGLDEVDGQTATRLVDLVSAMIESRRGSVALLTSRPGVLSTSDQEQPWEGLSLEQARSVVESVSGKPHVTWEWNPTLLESVRRPFFAIGAGIMLADGTKPSSQADLIRRLVERALAEQTSSAVAVQDSDLYRLLVRVAVELTASGGVSDGRTFQERQQLRRTRLAAVSDGMVEFTLPIFQQWFAAQALLEQEPLLLASVASAASFDRWRWSLAIAGLSVTSAEQFDGIAGVLLNANTGAGSWVLDQVASARDWPKRGENDFVDPATAGQRILRATRSWIDAIGPLASAVFPVADDRQPISLRVAVGSGTVSTVWDRATPVEDVVSGLDPQFSAMDDGDHTWREISSGGAIAGFEWPWVRVHERIAKATLKVLEQHPRLGPVDGVWHNESRYRLARTILNSRSFMFPALDRQQLNSAVQDFLSRWDDPLNVRWIINGEQILGGEVIDLATWIEGLEGDFIDRPLPAPDEELRGSFVWDVYSPSRLREFVAEAYGQACDAYDQACGSVFSNFAWSLGTGAPNGFGVIAIVEAADTGRGWQGAPGLMKALVPLSALEAEVQRFGHVALLSENGRALVVAREVSGLPDGRQGEHEYFADLLERVGSAGSGAFGRRSIMSRGVDFTAHTRPASELAARWLWEDLKAVKLGKGTFPQFR